MASAIKYAKNGRPLERVGGRWLFVSHRRAQQVTWAETGQIVTEYVGGREWHRGPDGTRVPASVAAMQDEPRHVVGRGKRRKEIHIEPTGEGASKAPRGVKSARRFTSHFNSVPRNILDFGAQDRDQFVHFRGKYYRIKPENAGEFSDAARLIHDRYIHLFLGLTTSPQLTVPVIMTSAGPVWDFDDLEFMSEELAEGMDLDDNEDVADAMSEMLTLVNRTLSTLTNEEQTKATKKAAPTRKGGKRAGSSKGANTRKRKR